jgi:lipopolysaccharide export system protein LptA
VSRRTWHCVDEGILGSGRWFGSWLLSWMGAWLVYGVAGWQAWCAEVMQGPVRGGFSVAEADRETGERKWLLRGESATPTSTDEILIQGARMEVYGAGGVTNLVFNPERCIYHQRTRRVTSSERLGVLTGDGQMAIEGVGFGLELESGVLVVSNDVRALIRRDTLQAGRPGGVGTVGAASAASGDADRMEVRADRLEYETARAIFLGQVRVEDGRGVMTCRRLEAELNVTTREVERILAQEEVIVESEQVRGRAERVTYDPASERLVLEGEPSWEIEGRTGRADRVTVARLERRVNGVGGVRMEIPARALVPGGVWPGRLSGDAAAPGLEGPMKVASDEFEYGPDPVRTNVNVMIFRGEVLVEESGSTLRCGMLTVETSEAGQEARLAVAEEGVVMERGQERIECARAVYEAETGLVTLGGKTTWRMEGREGRSETFVADLKRGLYRATGEVAMRLAAEGLGTTLGISKAGVGVDGDGGAGKVEDDPESREPLEIRSREFEYRVALEAGARDTARYDGEVVVSEGDRLRLSCGTLTATLGSGTNQVEEMVAERDVEIRMTEEDGYRLARGDRAEYWADRSSVELTGAEGVEFFIVTSDGVSRGVGRRAVYDGVTELLELEGDAWITTPDGELNGGVVQFDRARSTLSATGHWRVRLPIGRLRLPELPSP